MTETNYKEKIRQLCEQIDYTIPDIDQYSDDQARSVFLVLSRMIHNKKQAETVSELREIIIVQGTKITELELRISELENFQHDYNIDLLERNDRGEADLLSVKKRPSISLSECNIPFRSWYLYDHASKSIAKSDEVKRHGRLENATHVIRNQDGEVYEVIASSEQIKVLLNEGWKLVLV